MKWIVQGFLLVVLLVLIGSGAAAYWGWNELNTPIEHAQQTEIEIPTGSSPDAVIGKLAQNGIVNQSLPLKVYVKLTGAGRLFKAGSYKFASPITPLQAIKRLEEGGEALAKVTVIEGWNRWDIASALARAPKLSLRDSKQALALLNDTKEIHDIAPTAANLEGYLFPDTYFIDAHTSAPTLVSQMVSRFKGVWQSKLSERSKSLGLTAQQVVTIASLIETEAKLPEERPIVASVIYNRLRKGIPLALDCTLVYASKAAGAWKNDGKVYQSDIDRKSPYNTRKVKGLPPGPIGSPGLPSLEAALNPSRTDFIYYVRNPARDDGAHNFYADAAGFEQGVLALRAWERQRDQQRASQLQQAPPPTHARAPRPIVSPRQNSALEQRFEELRRSAAQNQRFEAQRNAPRRSATSSAVKPSTVTNRFEALHRAKGSDRPPQQTPSQQRKATAKKSTKQSSRSKNVQKVQKSTKARSRKH